MDDEFEIPAPQDAQPVVPLPIEEIAKYLVENMKDIDTFIVMAFPRPGERLKNLFKDKGVSDEEAAPSFAFFQIGSFERGVEQFDEFVRIHMEIAPQIIQASQARARRRMAEAAMLVSPEGKPLLRGGH